MSSADEMFMRGAFALARRALGRTWPNPAVGAVIVRPGNAPEIVSRGWTMPGGRPHAERVALDRADGRAGGCTLYVTLEPCAHHGRTPPCADAIVEAGIARVVCPVRDPDPRVAGAGLARLREAGIDVTVGVLVGEGERIARGHILRVTRSRPSVQLKLAVGSDGLVPKGDGTPVWVTGEEARAHAHLLRARADAILVGSGTIAADNPELACRLPGMRDRSPVRVVLDTRLGISPDTKLVSGAGGAQLWIFCSEDAPQDRANGLKATGAEIVRVAQNDQGWLDPAAVLAELAGRGITRLLIEGGPRVAGSFWRAGLADEICLYQGSEAAGPAGLKALCDEGVEVLAHSPTFIPEETRSLGRDRLTVYRRSER